MADSSIVIDVELDDKKAQAELNRLQNSIERLHDKVRRATSERMPLLEQAQQLGVELDAAKAKLEEMQNAPTGTVSPEQIAAQKENVAILQAQWDAVNKQIEAYDRQIQKANSDIEWNEQKVGELSAQLAGVGETGSAAGEALSDAMQQAASRVEKLGHRIGGLIKRVFVFSLITKALRALRSWLSETAKTNAEAATAIGNLKGALLTLAQPILSVVIPAITALVTAITKVVSAIASIVSVLFGTTVKASADSAKAMNEEKKALEGVGGAGEDAAKQLANFDEINQLTFDEGGGGGGGADAELASLFDTISEFQLPDWLNDFLDSLRITIKDVFFDWDNLTGEQIAEKCLVGLFALTGGVVGFILGGVPGAIVGTLTGLVIGLVISSLTFNHDGKLSATEVCMALAAVLITALGGLLVGGAAAAVGASIAAGAAIGLAIGAALAIGILSIKWSYDRAVEERAESSPLGQAIKAALDGSVAALEAAADLKLDIESVTGEISDEDLATLERAQTLIKEIFELDEVDNKTAAQVTILKGKIDELNGMGLDGIQLSFDETTQHVTNTKEEVLATLDAIKRQYQLEAMHDAIVTQYKNEYQAKKDVKDATEGLEEATDLYKQAVEEAAKAEEDYQAASDNYKIALQNETEAYNDALEALISSKTERDAARENVERAKTAVENYSEALQQSLDNFDAATKSVGELEQAYDDLVVSISENTEEAKKGGKNIMEGTAEGIDEGYSDAEEAIRNAHEALQRAADEVDGISSPSTVYWEKGKYIMEGLANGITDNAYLAEGAMIAVCNSLSSLFERGINGIINQYNSLAGKVNTAGGDVSMPVLQNIAVPRLAAGAVIPANHEFLAVLGDQKQGTNVEAPLETILAAFRQALSEANADRELVLKVGEYEFGHLIFNTFNTETARVGVSMVR